MLVFCLLQDMSVKLSAPGIPYLDRATIEEYSNLRFFSVRGELVKINPIILAAVNSSLVECLHDDYEESDCVITEFTKSELDAINEFSWTGKVDYDNSKVFKALGIDLEHMFDRKPAYKPVTSNANNVEVKLRVKEEPLDFDGNSMGYYGEDSKEYRKRRYQRDEFIDDDEAEEEYADDDDDYDYEADKYERKKAKIDNYYSDYSQSNHGEGWDDDDDWGWDWEADRKHFKDKKARKKRTPKIKKEDPDVEFDPTAAAALSEEQQKLFETWELPKPLEEYKSQAQEPKVTIDDKDNPLACHLCPSRFKNDYGLQSHLIKFHSEHYACTSCYKAFALNDIDKFKLHIFKHQQQLLMGKNYCIQCGASFQRSNGLHEHQKLRGQFHDDQCAQCEDRFVSHEDYKSHVEQKHGGIWKFKCGFCKELFNEKRDLRAHFKTFHEAVSPKPTKKYVPKKTICVECGKLVYNLKNHMVSAHGNEKHPCPHCGLILKTHPRLQKHISWIHITAPCTECGEMVGVGKMTRHIEQKHTSIYDRKFKCDVCGKGFSDNTKLRDHKNVHTGEKPYKCKFCSAAFASAGSHATHQKSHLGYRRSK